MYAQGMVGVENGWRSKWKNKRWIIPIERYFQLAGCGVESGESRNPFVIIGHPPAPCASARVVIRFCPSTAITDLVIVRNKHVPNSEFREYTSRVSAAKERFFVCVHDPSSTVPFPTVLRESQVTVYARLLLFTSRQACPRKASEYFVFQAIDYHATGGEADMRTARGTKGLYINFSIVQLETIQSMRTKHPS